MSIAEHLHRAGWDGAERRHLRDPHYEGPERRHGPASNDARVIDLRLRTLEQQSAEWADALRRIDRRFADGSDRMNAMQAELTQNTLVTTEVRDLLQLARNGLRLLGWLGTGTVWLAKLLAALGACWAAWEAFRHGGKP